MMSFSKAVALTCALFMGASSVATASLAREYEILRDGGLSPRPGRTARSSLRELLRDTAPKQKFRFELDGDDLQKYYEAASELDKAGDEGKRKGESDEDFAKRLKPIAEKAAEALGPIFESVVEQIEKLGNVKGLPASVVANAKGIEIRYGKVVEADGKKKIQLTGKVVVKLDIENEKVTGYDLKVYTVKKTD